MQRMYHGALAHNSALPLMTMTGSDRADRIAAADVGSRAGVPHPLCPARLVLVHGRAISINASLLRACAAKVRALHTYLLPPAAHPCIAAFE